ncbi:GGDEF domain-containing protein [Frankia sp. AgW1.1]|nr:GGDEF domain-containing protein [Frankia sp. AgW1.1]
MVLTSAVCRHFVDDRTLVYVQAATLLGTSVFAVCTAGVGVARSQGEELRWRLLVAAGPLGSLAGAIEWTRQYTAEDPSLAPGPPDVAFLIAPLLMVGGLLCIPSQAKRRCDLDRARDTAAVQPVGAGRVQESRSGYRYSNIVATLDGLVIVVSMLLIVWLVELEKLLKSGIRGLSFVISLGYAVIATLLVVVLVLVVSFRRPRNRRSLALLALGLSALAASETALVQLSLARAVGTAGTVSFWTGAAVGIPLIGLALVVPERRGQPIGVEGHQLAAWWSARADAAWRWLQAYLPYLPLGAAAVLLVGLAVTEGGLRGVPLALAFCLAALGTARQLMIISQNRRLLCRVQSAQRTLRYQAFHDGLTGLANRTLFVHELEAAVTAHRESGEEVSLLFCDLDNFKAVNDTLGHAAGDELLRAVAERLRRAFRDQDLVARLGGDEFAVLLQEPLPDSDLVENPATHEDPTWRVGAVHAARGTTDRAHCLVVAAMSQPFVVAGRRWPVRASVGIALADGDQPFGGAEQLMHRADTAMYASKRQGSRTRCPSAERRRST